METYEGPVDSIYRIQDVENAAQALGAKITGLFKRGPAHLDYPTSGPYDGPLASTSLAWDVEGEPLQQHVSVYHSGRSDER
uniref:Ald_Xan_dh_C2 domain-containing protein n=1 Tax=Loa loa TaxID=7209 RepID=A0A1I7VJC0_LOALO